MVKSLLDATLCDSPLTGSFLRERLHSEYVYENYL